MEDFTILENYLKNLQDKICQLIQNEETISFVEDQWQHKEGGGGITRSLAGGEIIEKAGVNFSYVSGDTLPATATANRPALLNSRFQALGVSVVVHPRNPYIPTTHANVRFISTKKPDGSDYWWFGGGFDLTPYYPFLEDCQHWHRTAKAACDPFGPDIYSRYKKACDQYFYLPHRQEPRGIGGLFFDDLNEWGFAQSFSFMQSIGEHFIQAYFPILQKRKNHLYGERERNFQLYRRGRYVEFNLLYDRGTLFGLQSQGRTESILMSLPPLVSWQYNWIPSKNSEEEKLYKEFLVVRDWI